MISYTRIETLIYCPWTDSEILWRQPGPWYIRAPSSIHSASVTRYPDVDIKTAKLADKRNELFLDASFWQFKQAEKVNQLIIWELKETISA